METVGNTFCDKTVDRNGPMKLLLLQPIGSCASAATHVSIIFSEMHVIGVARQERSGINSFIHSCCV